MNYSDRSSRRVVITGIGIVNPAGIGKDDFWHNIRLKPKL